MPYTFYTQVTFVYLSVSLLPWWTQTFVVVFICDPSYFVERATNFTTPYHSSINVPENVPVKRPISFHQKCELPQRTDILRIAPPIYRFPRPLAVFFPVSKTTIGRVRQFVTAVALVLTCLWIINTIVYNYSNPSHRAFEEIIHIDDNILKLGKYRIKRKYITTVHWYIKYAMLRKLKQ